MEAGVLVAGEQLWPGDYVIINLDVSCASRSSRLVLNGRVCRAKADECLPGRYFCMLCHVAAGARLAPGFDFERK